MLEKVPCKQSKINNWVFEKNHMAVSQSQSMISPHSWMPKLLCKIMLGNMCLTLFWCNNAAPACIPVCCSSFCTKRDCTAEPWHSVQTNTGPFWRSQSSSKPSEENPLNSSTGDQRYATICSKSHCPAQISERGNTQSALLQLLLSNRKQCAQLSCCSLFGSTYPV